MKIKLEEKTYDGILYVAPSWEEMGYICFFLAKDILEKKKNYDRVVALAKGGWTWARAFVDFLKIDNIASVQFKFYTGIGKTNDKPTILQPLSTSVKGEKILLFDDVADSGKTLVAAKEYLVENGAKSVEIATLFYKPRSIIKPDFYSYITSAWVIFPHEIREIVEQAGKSWLKNGLSEKDVLKRFKKLSLPMNQIEYFIDKI